MTPRGLLAAAATGGLAAFGGPAMLGVATLVEAGVPIPLPGDIVVLVLGARVATGGFPLWLAIVGLEVAAVIGMGALLLLCHGPANALMRRLGKRVGLTDARLARVAGLIERRGTAAVIAGRATPGLRTASVIATGTSGVPLRKLFPALLIGSTIFVQSHLVLGMVLGPAAVYLLENARIPLICGAVVLLIGGLAVWAYLHGHRGALHSWSHAGCPACLVTGLIAGPEDKPGAMDAVPPAR
jgi:membrane protein DedA with SNARE-associated domain